MKSNHKNIVQSALSISVGILIILLFFRKFGSEEIEAIKTAVAEANYGWVLLSLILAALAHVSRSLRWRSLIEALGYKISFLNSLIAVTFNYLVNMGLPRAGELARCVAINRMDEVPVEKSFGTVVNERITDLVMLALVGVLTAIFQYEKFIQFYTERMAPFFQDAQLELKHYILVLGGLLLGVIGVIVLYTKKKDWFKSKLNGLIEGVLSLRNLKNPWTFIFHTFFMWTLYYLMTYLAILSVVPVGEVSWFAGLTLLFFGTFGFIVIQGGLGVYPIVISWVLMLYGVSEQIGVAAGWIMWSSQTVLNLVGGFISAWLLGRRSK